MRRVDRKMHALKQLEKNSREGEEQESGRCELPPSPEISPPAKSMALALL